MTGKSKLTGGAYHPPGQSPHGNARGENAKPQPAPAAVESGPSRVFVQDSDLTLYQGDALEVLRSLPDGCVHMCVTSPPFYGLRDYGTGSWVGGDEDCDHLGEPFRTKAKMNENWGDGYQDVKNAEDRQPFKTVCGKCGARRVDQQIGLEETPEQWVEKLVGVFREVRRVLRSDGSCWVEVGDSYGANQGKGFNTQAENGYAEVGRNRTDLSTPIKHPYKPKDLIGAPWMLAFALRADGWYLRSDIIWSRPNPMPESVTDRPTKSHSYVFLLSKSARYFFDQEAVREPHDDRNRPIGADGLPVRSAKDGTQKKSRNNQGWGGRGMPVETVKLNPAGRNVRSVWQIATQPYPEAHFATYPEELVRRCILAGSSERGCCTECGAPWTREVQREPSDWAERRANGEPVRHGLDGAAASGAGGFAGLKAQTLGWIPGCSCGTSRKATVPGSVTTRLPLGPVPCTVLDPFFGSGTTGLVARKHGRRTIGIELSSAYCELAGRRLQQLSLLA